MKIAIITMVYNESLNLPMWVNHYSNQCPGSELYVIDHGSDISVRESQGGVNVLRIPRSDFDERRRAELVSRLHNTLLLEFDWVFYTDCDELIVSATHGTISEALAEEDNSVKSIVAVGMNLWHRIDEEKEFDRSRSISEQRQYATFEKFMCKPFTARVPISWIPGFHTSNLPPCFGSGYYQIHTKYIDHHEALERLALTSGLNWSSEALEKGWSSHQRVSAEKLTTKFKNISGLIAQDKISDFEFDDHVSRFLSQSVEDSKGNYRCDAVYEGMIVRVPSELLGLLP